MFVLGGTGRATVGKTQKSTRTVRLKPGACLLIEKGEMHRVASGAASFGDAELIHPPGTRQTGRTEEFAMSCEPEILAKPTHKPEIASPPRLQVAPPS
jgi:mannose-6-phosphate isomerase-like protein (cupin superfamily)